MPAFGEGQLGEGHLGYDSAVFDPEYQRSKDPSGHPFTAPLAVLRLFLALSYGGAPAVGSRDKRDKDKTVTSRLTLLYLGLCGCVM